MLGKQSGVRSIINPWRLVSRPWLSAACLPGVGTVTALNLTGIDLTHDRFLVIRMMLVRENKRLDMDELGALKGANKERIEEFARLEGITIEEAMERKRGFRYLY